MKTFTNSDNSFEVKTMQQLAVEKIMDPRMQTMAGIVKLSAISCCDITLLDAPIIKREQKFNVRDVDIAASHKIKQGL